MLQVVQPRQPRAAGDEGFTLIELLVVLLIIGILLAIAIPTFLTVTNTASDNAAQADLQTALTAAKTYYMQQDQSYSGICDAPSGGGTGCTGARAGGIQGVDTGLSTVLSAVAADGPHMVSIATVNAGTGVVLASLGRGSPNCWGIVDLTTGASALGIAGPGTIYFEEPDHAGALAAPCEANSFVSAAAVSGVRTSRTGWSSFN